MTTTEYQDELICSATFGLPLRERLGLVVAILFGWSSIHVTVSVPLIGNGHAAWNFHTFAWWNRLRKGLPRNDSWEHPTP